MPLSMTWPQVRRADAAREHRHPVLQRPGGVEAARVATDPEQRPPTALTLRRSHRRVPGQCTAARTSGSRVLRSPAPGLGCLGCLAPLVCTASPPAPQFHGPSCVLIGDAAHPVTPSLGQVSAPRRFAASYRTREGVNGDGVTCPTLSCSRACRAATRPWSRRACWRRRWTAWAWTPCLPRSQPPDSRTPTPCRPWTTTQRCVAVPLDQSTINTCADRCPHTNPLGVDICRSSAPALAWAWAVTPTHPAGGSARSRRSRCWSRPSWCGP